MIILYGLTLDPSLNPEKKNLELLSKRQLQLSTVEHLPIVDPEK
jgi:hypothetical protein